MTTPTSAPTDIAGATALLSRGGEARAGGTDVMARRNSGLAPGPLTDIGRIEELHGVGWSGSEGARIGAATPIAAIASDPELSAAYPALAATAGALATPQVRAVGTLGGNLMQRNRCWYFRNPGFSCMQDGGEGCPAREGDHRYGVAVDTAPCAAPHPSSMAMALLVYDARVAVAGPDGAESERAVRDLYDPADGTRDHVLAPGELVTAVRLPAPTTGERAAYHRATGRARAEWPLAEAVARLTVADGRITSAAVAAGGVARIPIRLPEVEAALLGGPAVPESAAEAVAGVPALCTPLPGTRYKPALFRDTVRDVLERALA